ncbi:MAG: CotH kinase family protein [Clostridia bacterium]|nr:CotH kinase family protein [Clostridia bacterium]
MNMKTDAFPYRTGSGTKKRLCLFLALITALSLLPARAFAQTNGLQALSVNPYGGAADAIDTVFWYADGDARFLFLPADADLSKATLYYTADAPLYIGGKKIENGAVNTVIKAPGVYELSCGGKKQTLQVLCSENLPAVYLRTESGSLENLHLRKENKEKADIRIYENGEITVDETLKQIKGRGNSTFYYPKKPYNIKFDKKTDLFGMGKAKKWTMLASYFDTSLLRNPYGWAFADAFGLDFTSRYRHADVFINGEYLGNYIFCESVEVGENRVEIADLEKANEDANDADPDSCPLAGTGKGGTVQSGRTAGSRKWAQLPVEPADVSGGYLLEFDFAARYDDEPCGFVTKSGQPVVIKSPEYAGKKEVNYIADLFEEAYEALESPTGVNSRGRHYSAYFDMDSLVNMYLLQELSLNYDAGLSSFYVYKNAGQDKLVFSPVWDMDNAFASQAKKYGAHLSDSGIWWANCIEYHSIPTVLTAAYGHEDFRAAAAARWAELQKDTVSEKVNAQMAALAESVRASAVMNGIRWNHYETMDPEAAAGAWAQEKQRICDFVTNRTAALSTGFGDKGVWVRYDKNGATGDNWGFPHLIRTLGETLHVKDPAEGLSLTPPTGYVFCGWNTEPDGSGVMYQPGDTLQLTKRVIFLYAIWKTPDEIEREKREPYCTGDVNGDRDIGALDARLALRCSVGLEKFARGSAQFRAADADGNGRVEAFDARLILRAGVGLEKLA